MYSYLVPTKELASFVLHLSTAALAADLSPPAVEVHPPATGPLPLLCNNPGCHGSTNLLATIASAVNTSLPGIDQPPPPSTTSLFLASKTHVEFPDKAAILKDDCWSYREFRFLAGSHSPGFNLHLAGLPEVTPRTLSTPRYTQLLRHSHPQVRRHHHLGHWRQQNN